MLVDRSNANHIKHTFCSSLVCYGRANACRVGKKGHVRSIKWLMTFVVRIEEYIEGIISLRRESKKILTRNGKKVR